MVLGKKNDNHAGGWAVVELHLPPFNLVGHVRIFDVEAAGVLAGRTFPVNLELLGSFVVLVEASGACVPLGLDEKVGPYHTGHNIVHPDKLDVKLRVSILCFLQKSMMEHFPNDIVPPV